MGGDSADRNRSDSVLRERYELALNRIREIRSEQEVDEKLCGYFSQVADFVIFTLEGSEKLESMSEKQQAEFNKKLYEEVLEAGYENSYLNPATAVSEFGEDYGRLLSFLYFQIRGIIPFSFELKKDERRLTDIVIFLETFLEVYSAFVCAGQDGHLPEAASIKEILYYFISDYAEITIPERIQEQLDPELDFALDIIMNADLAEPSYLYRFGEYITENEIKTSQHLANMSEEQIQAMADTYTEGYRIGFVMTGKDLSKKSTVNIRYSLGFERIIKAAVRNFEKLGLKTVLYRSGVHLLSGSSASKIGYYGAIANRQYDYDHREDLSLFWDKALKDRRIELLEAAYEEQKQLANGHAGPAVMEVFGENPFSPVVKKEAAAYSQKQQKLVVEYMSKAGEIVNKYIKGEERSFTIIAYPVPEIGDKYDEIFDETVRINTLDYKFYQGMQQSLIDVLDKGVKAHITGRGKNETDLYVGLRSLEKPDKETQFENCVADVNIPVGEVFTTPVLEGTNGLLHVSRVYLNDLEFKDLRITFREGFIEDYSCGNFADAAEGKKYIEDNVLMKHSTLPMGEFAIGTNTTAYVMAKKYDIFDRLPILIAEKTGPHFAVGDSCYSHAEEVAVFNPDGKEIISRENTCSLKRKDSPAEAYFNCHTDITIPYDELGDITVTTAEGDTLYVIKDGLFEVEGAKALNEPLM